MNRSDLHKYQTGAVEFIKDKPYALLLIDLGLGKTVISLTAVSDLISEGEIEKVLVVAPMKVAESTWTTECEKWSHLRWLRTSVVLGTPARRRKALEEDADIYITSRDLFVKVIEECEGKFDMVILDEITSFKNSKSKRFKAFRKIRPNLGRVIGLTGTPTPNGLKDIWAQMYCIDMGERLGRAKTRFLASWFDFYNRNGVLLSVRPKKGAEEKIYSLIRPVTLTMKSEDYLELPEMIERTVKVKLSDKAMNEYRKFEREQVMMLGDTLNSPENVIASSAASLCNKLMQFSNGAVYDEERGVHHMHDDKMDMLVEMIESALAEGEHVLVFYQFKHDYERLMERKEMKEYRCRHYNSNQDLVDWNEGWIDVLITHAASTAYGLNLQQGGHVVMWYGTGWNAELYLQGNARLHRQGQKKATKVFKIVAAGTIDEDAEKAISGKVSGQEAMLQALKSRIEQYK